ncbi:MAG: RDD family protein [Candidatus Hydrogenedentes bacterium]|nr:RDD family protein [Candidatus Hydrogenedentota bacterium]
MKRRERVNSLSIRTPEGIVFSMMLAGPVTRFLAYIIDVAVQVIVLMIVSYIAGLLGVFTSVLGPTFYEWVYALVMIASFAVPILYAMVLEWLWRGQTVGKRLLRLRVVDENGLRLQFTQVAIRNLLRVVDSLPALYVVGGIACVVSQKGQRLGDFAANTVVIRTPKIAEPNLDHVLSSKYNSLRDYPHIEARLRQRVSPEEAAIALQAVLRRDELDPEARIKVFEEIAAHFKTLAIFPEQATFGTADEQFVRNVVDVLFRKRETTAAAKPDKAGVGTPL